MLVRACGAKPADGSILRSRGYLLFGNGVATLLPQAETLAQGLNGVKGYVMEFVQKRDPRNVAYWEVQISVDQTRVERDWRIEASCLPPDSDEGIHFTPLVEQQGKPGQYFYLTCVA
ncbi:MAG: hypothetical protein JNN11_03760 [Candidatus Doudnabacteria bacterium]|nr:hypothetical protein [Candidatus Doudnabacteria bacterium]